MAIFNSYVKLPEGIIDRFSGSGRHLPVTPPIRNPLVCTTAVRFCRREKMREVNGSTAASEATELWTCRYL